MRCPSLTCIVEWVPVIWMVSTAVLASNAFPFAATRTTTALITTTRTTRTTRTPTLVGRSNPIGIRNWIHVGTYALGGITAASSAAANPRCFQLSTTSSSSSSSINSNSNSNSVEQEVTMVVDANKDSSATTTCASVPKLQDVSPSYLELIQRLKTITNLERAQAVLSYDQLVFMPQTTESSEERGAQLSAMASIIHEKSTDPKLVELILASKNDLVQQQQQQQQTNSYQDETRVLEIEHKKFQKTARVPSELASKASELTSSAYGIWVQARQENDFSKFAPILKECFDTAIQIADAKRRDPTSQLDEGKEDAAAIPSIYTQMLDDFETGMPKQRIDEIFSEIQSALVPLLAQVMEAIKTNESYTIEQMTKPFKGTFSIDKQKELSKRIVTQLGYDETKGRIDVSVHPFSNALSPADVRITSRFQDSDWFQGLAGSIHECGHAMYEQNLPTSALSIDKHLSMGTHESQSLFWERHVGLSKPFWKWATPMVQRALYDENDSTDNVNYSWQDMYRAANAVSKGFIRVEADELSYPLHVILRYNIETDIIGGNLSVEEIPNRWNQDMKQLLDIDVPSDDKGCLQDIHWSGMAIGYFPTYLIGSATAAQLAFYCQRDIPDFDEQIERGEFQQIKQWLTSKIHRHGCRYENLDQLLEAQLGEPLNPIYFIQYLTSKYRDLYNIK